MKTCGTCKYWAYQQSQPDGTSVGQCHRAPPQLFVVQLPNAAQVMSNFPTSQRGQWCGEWKLLTVNENEKGN